MKNNLILLSMFLLAVLSSCGSQAEGNEDAAEVDSTAQVRVKYVEIDTVEIAEYSHFIEVQGVADTDNNISLTAKTPGTVEKVYVREGDEVKAGQLLIQLDDDVLRNSIAEVKTQLELATALFNKQKSLWDDKIGSEVQYLQAKNNKESLQGRLATLREQLAMTKVTAPISGTVDEIMVNQGEMASPGIPLGRIINLSDFEIKAQVAENYTMAVKKGTPAVVYFPDLKQGVETEIDFVGNIINPVDRTFRIILRISKPEIPIKPNMVAQVKIRDIYEKEAITVPVNLIRNDSDGPYVFIASNSGTETRAKRVSVETGSTYMGLTQIKNGLEPGQELITFGFQDLTDGQLIKH